MQTKQEHGKGVPTWTYVAIHAYAPVEFFDESDRLLGPVTPLTNRHKDHAPNPGRSPTRRKTTVGLS